jgi:hypothetical protein
VITYKQAADKKVAENILAFQDDALNVENEYNYEDQLDDRGENAICSAVVFMEKLFTQRSLYGTIKAICE